MDFERQQRGDLRHRLDDQHAGHHRMVRIMPGKNGSLIVTVLQRDDFLARSIDNTRSTSRNG